jgi:hypothetical protein
MFSLLQGVFQGFLTMFHFIASDSMNGFCSVEVAFKPRLQTDSGCWWERSVKVNVSAKKAG